MSLKGRSWPASVSLFFLLSITNVLSVFLLSLFSFFFPLYIRFSNLIVIRYFIIHSLQTNKQQQQKLQLSSNYNNNYTHK